MNADKSITKYAMVPALVTGILLMIPLIAMQFTDEAAWTISDFIFAGTLLFGTGLTYKLITRKSESFIYRSAIASALLSGLLLIWVNGAVGIIGTESNPVNLLYYGVIAIGLLGALWTWFNPDGMKVTMLAMALAQALVAATALAGGFYRSPPSSVIEILGVNGFFITLFLVSSLLFRQAGNPQSKVNVEPEV